MPSDQQLDLIATCTFGLEAVVVRELEQLGYDAKAVATGRVEFAGDWRAVCEANLWLRAADRVLLKVGSFPVGGGDHGFDLLFEGVKALAWEKYIAIDAAFPVAGRSVRSQITSEPAIQRATKRAIVDRLRGAYASGGIPAILPETGATVQIEIAVVKDVATLTLDTSGPGLHKRGYREGMPGEAALKETLAAGLVLLSVWRPGSAGKVRPLVDPFCGSGTIAIEAAMWARSIAPGLNRAFACEQWVDPRSPGTTLIDRALWEEVRQEAREAVVPERLSPAIHASDIDDHALSIARYNAKRAGVDRDIHFVKRDVRDISSSLHHGVIITNPPYGVRLGEEREIIALYRQLPAVFKRLPTWSFHVFTGVLNLEDLFGQPATRRRKMYNSTIECCLFTFLGPKPGGVQERDDGEAASGEPEANAADTAGDDAAESAPVDHSTLDAGDGTHSDLAVLQPPSTAREQRPSPAFGGLRERDKREAAEFGRCLANTLRHLRKYPARGVHCYRVYERDVPDVPLIVDRYGVGDEAQVWFHAVEYERQHSRTAAQQSDWFDVMRKTIAETAGVPAERVVMKEKHRQRGLTQHEKLDESRQALVVHEGDPALKFEVNLTDYIDTGLFLDHRLTRQMVRQEAHGKRFLNLFCYTGSFTVYAAAGGATSTMSVDLSNTYLAWARRNLELNDLMSGAHNAVCDDAMEFLRSHRPGEHYDLAVVDPPTFSNSKSMQEDWEVSSRHPELLTMLAKIMSPGGVVYFSNNYRRFKFDEEAVREAGFVGREISTKTVPPEYRNTKIHKCWRLTKI